MNRILMTGYKTGSLVIEPKWSRKYLINSYFYHKTKNKCSLLYIWQYVTNILRFYYLPVHSFISDFKKIQYIVIFTMQPYKKKIKSSHWTTPVFFILNSIMLCTSKSKKVIFSAKLSFFKFSPFKCCLELYTRCTQQNPLYR